MVHIQISIQTMYTTFTKAWKKTQAINLRLKYIDYNAEEQSRNNPGTTKAQPYPELLVYLCHLEWGSLYLERAK